MSRWILICLAGISLYIILTTLPKLSENELERPRAETLSDLILSEPTFDQLPYQVIEWNRTRDNERNDAILMVHMQNHNSIFTQTEKSSALKQYWIDYCPSAWISDSKPPFDDSMEGGIQDQVKRAVERYFDSAFQGMREEPRNGNLANILEKVKQESIYKESEFMVAVVSVNQAFIAEVLNLLCSLERVGYDTSKILLWALDRETEKVLLSKGYIAFFDASIESNPDLLVYGEAAYSQVMSQRPRFFLKLLEQGMDILFLDADLVFLAHPVDVLFETVVTIRELGEEIPDLFVQTDAYFYDFSAKNRYLPEACGGMFYLRNTERSRQFVSDILYYVEFAARNNFVKENDQTAMNFLLNSQPIYVSNWMPMVRASRPHTPKIYVYYLDQVQWMNGHLLYSNRWPQRPTHSLFCSLSTSSDWHPIMVHANSCKSKLKCLQRHGLVLIDAESLDCHDAPDLIDRFSRTLCDSSRFF